MPERLQKFLARAGVASRRHAEALITAGRVKVNNQTVTELGTKVEPGTDLVAVDGKLVSPPEDHAYFIFYKPAGVVTTMEDPQGRPTVAQYLTGIGRRVYPVGRLDFDAEGALVITDDGALAHALTHPSFEVRRTYLAKVKGTPTQESLERLLSGVRLEDGTAKALEASIFEEAERNTWIKIVVAEGRPHLIKRLCAAIGHPVVRLFRPSHGSISVKGLKPGELRALTRAEVERIKSIAEGHPAPSEPLALPPRRHGRGAPGMGEDEESFAPPPRATQEHRRSSGAGGSRPAFKKEGARRGAETAVSSRGGSAGARGKGGFGRSVASGASGDQAGFRRGGARKADKLRAGFGRSGSGDRSRDARTGGRAETGLGGFGRGFGGRSGGKGKFGTPRGGGPRSGG
ncbi:MAG: pseudouridine synthase, partial [Myxococcaceae bacterium]|nr:pseudouridine synthase [Myxococcaceae bacterium]